MTDTNQASELYELCKKVYERTGWEDVRDFYHENDTFDEETQTFKRNGIFSIVERKRADYNTPLYTSDYLLEKLPSTIENTDYNSGGIDRSKRIALQLRKWDRFVNGGMVYFAEYHEMYYIPLFRVEADTPLKALLKLTIALSEAGEL